MAYKWLWCAATQKQKLPLLQNDGVFFLISDVRILYSKWIWMNMYMGTYPHCIIGKQEINNFKRSCLADIQTFVSPTQNNSFLSHVCHVPSVFRDETWFETRPARRRVLLAKSLVAGQNARHKTCSVRVVNGTWIWQLQCTRCWIMKSSSASDLMRGQ